MTTLTTHGVVREILTKDPELKTEEVIRRANAMGLHVPNEKIRKSINNQRNPIRAQVAATKVAPAAARGTTPKAVLIEASLVSTTATGTPALSGMLANVALVNKIVGLCGGVENARQAAEAVQACGSTAAFLQHLELVAIIRNSESTK